jgi:3-hydroxyisobutyrate dehydrogenase
MKVAYIGLGSMGGDQAQLIAASDMDLAVFDPYPPALEKFSGNARLATSAADAAKGAEVVQICVRDDKQVSDVLFGTAGVMETVSAGSIVAVHSTIKIDTVKALHARLAERDVFFVDAPVARTRREATGPFVFTMIGGDPVLAERLHPLFALFSTDIKHVGPSGAAMALKISNNFVTWVQLVAGLQSMRLSTEFGVSFDALTELMQANGNLTPTMAAAMRGSHKLAPGTNPEMDAFRESQAGIGEKDLALAIEIGQSIGVDMQLAGAAQALLRPLFSGV